MWAIIKIKNGIISERYTECLGNKKGWKRDANSPKNFHSVDYIILFFVFEVSRQDLNQYYPARLHRVREEEGDIVLNDCLTFYGGGGGIAEVVKLQIGPTIVPEAVFSFMRQ